MKNKKTMDILILISIFILIISVVGISSILIKQFIAFVNNDAEEVTHSKISTVSSSARSNKTTKKQISSTSRVNEEDVQLKKEFEINKRAWKLIWAAPPGIEAENQCIRKIAQEYGISTTEVDRIMLYFESYSQRFNSPVEDMTWEQFKRRIR